jgi:hypothetical protein
VHQQINPEEIRKMSRFSNMKLRTKIAVGATLGAAVLGGGGMLAFAYFTSNGSGTGSAGVGSSSPVTITQTGTVSGLVPNGPAQTINYKVTNPGSGSEYVNQVMVSVASISGAGTTTGPGVDACTPSLFQITQGSAIATDVAGGASASGTATISLPDDGNNQNNCQGATVNLSFTSN